MWVYALHEAYGAYPTHQPKVDRKISHLAFAARTIHPLTMDYGSYINHVVQIALSLRPSLFPYNHVLTCRTTYFHHVGPRLT